MLIEIKNNPPLSAESLNEFCGDLSNGILITSILKKDIAKNIILDVSKDYIESARPFFRIAEPLDKHKESWLFLRNNGDILYSEGDGSAN